MKTRTNSLTAAFFFLFFIMAVPNTLYGYPTPKDVEEEQLSVNTTEYKTYSGLLKDSKTNAPLVFANITVNGTNIATISNSDGEFNLKVGKDIKATTLQISHIGYNSKQVPFSTLKKEKNVIKLDVVIISLDAINIYPYDADFLVQNMINKVSENYPKNANMMKGFYRETIKKNKNYVGISEAVVDIYKAGYREMFNDQVKIYKGRKSEDYSKMDTLVFKLQGGPATTLLFDIMKNPYNLLSDEYINEYTYKIENITEIDGKPHYVVGFKQNEESEFPLYNGRYFIEANTLALTSAEFSMNLENQSAVTQMLIRKKPAGLKVTPLKINYLVSFKEHNGTWYFNYARGEMKFKFNWKKKLFNTHYSAMMEIAVTDRDENNIIRFKGSEKFKTNQKLSEQVVQFTDEDFWGPLNTIEPDESIQSAINKLKKKGRF